MNSREQGRKEGRRRRGLHQVPSCSLDVPIGSCVYPCAAALLCVLKPSVCSLSSLFLLSRRVLSFVTPFSEWIWIQTKSLTLFPQMPLIPNFRKGISNPNCWVSEDFLLSLAVRESEICWFSGSALCRIEWRKHFDRAYWNSYIQKYFDLQTGTSHTC